MTAAELIRASHEDIGVLDLGEDPSSQQLAQGLRTLNTLLKMTATQRLGVFTVATESFPLTDGTFSYTIGTGGDFSTARPHRIITAFIRDANSLDYTLRSISREDYARLGQKDVDGAWPDRYYYETGYPLGALNFWPVVGSGYTLHLQSWKPLAAITDIGAELSLPDEYEAYLQYTLAVMLAPKNSVPVPAEVAVLAEQSKQILKSLHAQPVPRIETKPFPGRHNATYDIYRDY